MTMKKNQNVALIILLAILAVTSKFFLRRKVWVKLQIGSQNIIINI